MAKSFSTVLGLRKVKKLIYVIYKHKYNIRFFLYNLIIMEKVRWMWQKWNFSLMFIFEEWKKVNFFFLKWLVMNERWSVEDDLVDEEWEDQSPLVIALKKEDLLSVACFHGLDEERISGLHRCAINHELSGRQLLTSYWSRYIHDTTCNQCDSIIDLISQPVVAAGESPSKQVNR